MTAWLLTTSLKDFCIDQKMSNLFTIYTLINVQTKYIPTIMGAPRSFRRGGGGQAQKRPPTCEKQKQKDPPPHIVKQFFSRRGVTVSILAPPPSGRPYMSTIIFHSDVQSELQVIFYVLYKYIIWIYLYIV